MIAVSELKAWVDSLGKNGVVFVDEGGLTLVAKAPQRDTVYLEVGGDPEDE